MTEREWREASDLRMSRIGLAAVLAAAAILRFWALSHGIPHSVQVDEPEIVERAYNMMRSGSLNPHGFFDYPGFTLYLQFVVTCLRFLYGAIGGEWTSIAAANPASFYLWGRSVTAAIGVVTVLLVFQIGLRWGGRHGLLGAAILAVMPLHVRYSHYVLTDIPLTFFVTLTLLLSLIAHERNRVGMFALAGMAAGLAAATKYNGGLALVMPLVACWMTVPARPSRLVCALAALASAMVAFLIVAPYTILDLPGFLDGFARLAAEYRGAPPLEAPWSLYVKHLRLNFGLPALLMAVAGLTMGLVRVVQGPGRVRWAVLLVFPLMYFWMIARQQIVYARYLLPLVPMLCVLAAAAVISGVSLLRRYEIPRAPRSALIVALTILALLPPALKAIGSVRDAGRQWTQQLAYDWLVAHVPQGSRVVIESRELLLPRDKFDARNVSQLRQKSHDEYAADGVEYFVASSQVNGRFLEAPQQFPREYADYMRLFEQSRELVRFTPSAEHPGPELRIFKVRP